MLSADSLDGLEDIDVKYRVEVDEANEPFKPDVSAAISLKRIADALEKLIKLPELTPEENEEFERAAKVMFNKS